MSSIHHDAWRGLNKHSRVLSTPMPFATPHSVYEDLGSCHLSRQVQPPPGSPVSCRHSLPKSDSSSGSLCVQAVLGFPSPKLPSRSSIPIYLFYPTISLSHANLHHRILSLVGRKLRGQPIYPQLPSGKWRPFPDPPTLTFM